MSKNKYVTAEIIILFILLFINIAFIWFNSFITSEISNNSSRKVAYMLQQIVDPNYKIPKDIFMDYIRKSAHFIEFFILGAVITILHLIIKKTHIFTVLFVLLSVAVIDEFIQSLSDRTASVRDIILDFCGAVTGLIVVFIIYFTATLINKRVKYKTTIRINRPDIL